jgi:hypothetical protein
LPLFELIIRFCQFAIPPAVGLCRRMPKYRPKAAGGRNPLRTAACREGPARAPPVRSTARCACARPVENAPRAGR